ncbi:MAG: hypothetical protein KC431_16430 [Myxococcales bacterium]|nr:hypothetical protein [Myxococcales bacterium]
MREAALADAGIAALPRFLTEQALADGALVPVLPRWSLPSGTLSMLWPARRHLSPRVRAFIETAREFMAS